MGKDNKVNKRKICLVTGSRAEYGLSYWLMKAIKQDPCLCLQLVVTGAHLSSAFGSTCKVIRADGFQIDKEVDILRYSNTDKGVAESVGLGCKLFAQAFEELQPDIVLVFGDRYEIFSAVVAAYIARIPIAHVYGGETSQGAIDEGFRHAITKMASLHFTAADDYKRRVVQMGEPAGRVFNYGAPGLDSLYKLNLLTKDELAQSLNFDLGKRTAIVTYHPVTLEDNTAHAQARNLLKSLGAFDFKVIFTKANADAGGRIINREIENFCRKNPARCRIFDNLGQKRYFSCLKHCDFMAGNSSSGIIEAPSFKLPAVNIGDRQKGRLKAPNIIETGYSAASISRGIRRALSPEFRKSLSGIKNPYCKYSDGSASFRIKEKLKTVKLGEGIIKKKFYDLAYS